MIPKVDGDGVPQMRPERYDAIQQLLLDTIDSEPRLRAQRRRLRVAAWGSVAALVVVGTVTAGSLIQQAASVSNNEIVHCLESAELGPNGTYSGASATIAHVSGRGRVYDAIELCSTMWEQGVFNQEYDPLKPTNPPGDVPESLQVCVMKDGSAAVVPGSSRNLCQTIGLAPLRD